MSYRPLIRLHLIYNQAMITPGQASETLNVPPSTLRRWAKKFEDFLSPQTGSHRAYTLEDINTFRKIRDLLANGQTYKSIKEQLNIVETPKDQTKALATIPDLIQALQFASDQLANMKSQMDRQDERIKALEAWIALPWYRKIFTKPPEG